jgi:hypothetical protein
MVYIAGPYTTPDPVINTRNAIDAGMHLYGRGVAVPFIPHLTLFVHMLHPNPDVEFWYEYDLHAVERCDLLLRLPGQSTGADREVEYARSIGVPVFTDRELAVVWCRDWWPRKVAAR